MQDRSRSRLKSEQIAGTFNVGGSIMRAAANKRTGEPEYGYIARLSRALFWVIKVRDSDSSEPEHDAGGDAHVVLSEAE